MVISATPIRGLQIVPGFLRDGLVYVGWRTITQKLIGYKRGVFAIAVFAYILVRVVMLKPELRFNRVFGKN
jgi:hypothetical protein